MTRTKPNQSDQDWIDLVWIVGKKFKNQTNHIKFDWFRFIFHLNSNQTNPFILLPIVILGFLSPLAVGLSCIWFTLFTRASTNLLHTCPNQIRQDSTIFFHNRRYLIFFFKEPFASRFEITLSGIIILGMLYPGISILDILKNLFV